MHSIHGLTEAVRALEHEYANRLHIVDGLLGLGEVDQAKSYVSGLSCASRSLGEGCPQGLRRRSWQPCCWSIAPLPPKGTCRSRWRGVPARTSAG